MNDLESGYAHFRSQPGGRHILTTVVLVSRIDLSQNNEDIRLRVSHA